MKQVELLAPAGNYEALEGAICAGADAVYLVTALEPEHMQIILQKKNCAKESVWHIFMADGSI